MTYSISQGSNFIDSPTTWRGEGSRERVFTLGGGEACRGGKLRGDEVRPTAKALDDGLTSDVDSLRDIGDEEEAVDSCEGD